MNEINELFPLNNPKPIPVWVKKRYLYWGAKKKLKNALKNHDNFWETKWTYFPLFFIQ